jgi:hypothetical protein
MIAAWRAGVVLMVAISWGCEAKALWLHAFFDMVASVFFSHLHLAFPLTGLFRCIRELRVHKTSDSLIAQQTPGVSYLAPENTCIIKANNSM